MNKKSKKLIVCLVIFVFSMSCNTINSQKISHNDNEQSLTLPQNGNNTYPISEIDAETLCKKLKEIKKIPYDPRKITGDPIYDGLISQGKKAIPCLINKITDTTLIADPRSAPQVLDFRVGDAAVFILLIITEQNWQPEKMLSSDYAKKWESDGVYAYFAYVEDISNRKKLQQWWSKWAKENLSK